MQCVSLQMGVPSNMQIACLIVRWLGRIPSGVCGKPPVKRGQTQSSRGGHGRSRRFGFMRALAVTWLTVYRQFLFLGNFIILLEVFLIRNLGQFLDDDGDDGDDD